MTTDTAQSITDDGADAAEMTETVTAIGAIDGGAAVADPACPDSYAGRADQVFPHTDELPEDCQVISDLDQDDFGYL